jgi:hypothetical protein
MNADQTSRHTNVEIRAQPDGHAEPMHDVTATAARAAERISEGYDRPDRPLGGYLAIMGGYGALMTSAATLLARRNRLPNGVAAGDAVLLALATHKLSRTLTKDAVASPLRAPFTRFKGAAGPGEVNESVRGEGVQKAAGELISCPFCLDQWVASAFVVGLAVAPRVTRLIASTFAVRAGADFLHFAYAAAEHAAE